VTPDNYVAHYLLGMALVEQDKPEEATEHFKQAVALRPNDPTYHLNFGAFLEDQWGRTDEALHHFATAVRLQPESAPANYNMGKLLEKRARFDEAAAHFRRAIATQDDYAGAHRHLGQALLKQGKTSEAVEALRRAGELRPTDVAIRFSLADALYESGEITEADVIRADALRRDPDGPEKARKLAWHLATAKKANARDPWEAVRLARLANRSTDSRDPRYLDTLAAAFAAAGNFAQAEKTARQAIAMAENSQPKLAAFINERLRLYQQKQAFRE